MDAEEYLDKLARAGVPRSRAASALFALDNPAVAGALKYVFDRREIPTAAELAAWKGLGRELRAMPAAEVRAELERIAPELEARERRLEERRRRDSLQQAVSRGLEGLLGSLEGASGSAAGKAGGGVPGPAARGALQAARVEERGAQPGPPGPARLPDLLPPAAAAQRALAESLVSLAEGAAATGRLLAAQGAGGGLGPAGPAAPAGATRSFLGAGGVLAGELDSLSPAILRAAAEAVAAAEEAGAAMASVRAPGAEDGDGAAGVASGGSPDPTPARASNPGAPQEPPKPPAQPPERPPPEPLAPAVRQAVLSSIETNESLLAYLRASLDAEVGLASSARRASELSGTLALLSRGSAFESLAGDPAAPCPEIASWREEASRAAEALAQAKAQCHAELEANHYSYSTLQLLRAALHAQRQFLAGYLDSLQTLAGALGAAAGRAESLRALAEGEADLRLRALADAARAKAWAEGEAAAVLAPLSLFARGLKDCQNSLYVSPARYGGLLDTGEAVLGRGLRGPGELADHVAHAVLDIGAGEPEARADPRPDSRPAPGTHGPEAPGPSGGQAGADLANLTAPLLALESSVLLSLSSRFGAYLQNPRDISRLRGAREELCTRGVDAVL